MLGAPFTFCTQDTCLTLLATIPIPPPPCHHGAALPAARWSPSAHEGQVEMWQRGRALDSRPAAWSLVLAPGDPGQAACYSVDPFVPLSSERQLCPKPCLSLCSEHGSHQDRPTLGSTTDWHGGSVPIASFFLPAALRKSPKSCERETDESQVVVPREFGHLCIADQS